MQFSSNLQSDLASKERQQTGKEAEDQQEELKKKKKSRKTSLNLLKHEGTRGQWGIITRISFFSLFLYLGRLSRLLKRREKGVKGGAAGGGGSAAAAGNESPVYLPTGTHHSPTDDWSDWTWFTLELEVHPTSSLSNSIGEASNRLNEFRLYFSISFIINRLINGG